MNDGGQAFPIRTGMRCIAEHQYEFDAEPGMTLRDYFAGQAIVGVLATYAHPDVSAAEGWENVSVAHQAYKIADAMLKERANV